MKTKVSALILCLFLIFISSCTGNKDSKPQPQLGTRTVQIIEKRGLQFKDHNMNGKVDKYEDWKLSPEERSKDLLSRMSLAQKAGFICTNSLSPVGSSKAEASGGKLSASDLDEGAGTQGGNRPGGQAMTGERIATMGGTTGTTKVVKEFYNRHFILRLNEQPRILAEWSNKLQAMCESEPLGIPALIISNPRNHITTNPSLGTSLGATSFSAWPGELGLSAMKDLSLTREFADVARQEWLATGIRRVYGYMADLSTEPRWSRVNGTLGEKSEWVAAMIREIVLGFQGDTLSPSSVALTIKHFPGGGSGEKGYDSHYAYGKAEIYPGGMFDNNLIPFQEAINAGTAAIMPYYSLPKGTEYEEVGFAFNKSVINDLLRTKMGFKGIINSDTGPLSGMPWGVENLTIHERIKKALEAGVNTFSGVSDPKDIITAVDSGMVDISLIDNSVTLLLNELFTLGLFENPYLEEDAAEKIVNNSQFQARASLAMRKSIVLLRNESNALPVQSGTKIYFESLGRNSMTRGTSEKNIYPSGENLYNLQFVKDPKEADVVLLWLIPGGNALFGGRNQSDSEAVPDPPLLSLSKNMVNTDYINKISSRKPTILIINYTSPWVIDEIYNKNTPNIKGVIATFGTTQDALLDVITGKFNPTGKMPFSTPVSEEAAANQKEDVPGYMEGEGYALFNCDEGISYQ